MVGLGDVPPEAGHPRSDHEPVPIAREELKLLASDTRLDILKSLRHRRMTVSELAAALDLQKSTVHEHVTKLVEGGLVLRKDDPGREWVYYELSPKARKLLTPASAKIVLLLSGVVALGAAVAVVFLFANVNATAPLVVDLDHHDALAGRVETYRVTVRTEDGRPAAEGATVFLLDDAARAAVERGEPIGAGTGGLVQQPVVETVAPDVLEFRTSLMPGTRWVFVQDAEGDRSSRGDLEMILATPADVTLDVTPLVAGADDGRPIGVRLAYRGDPVPDARLVRGATALGLTDAAGRATVAWPALAPGEIAPLAYEIAPLRPHLVPVETFALVVNAPIVHVDAARAAAGTDAPLVVTVFHPARGGIAGARVTVAGVEATTDEDGRAVLAVDAAPDRAHPVRVGAADWTSATFLAETSLTVTGAPGDLAIGPARVLPALPEERSRFALVAVPLTALGETNGTVRLALVEGGVTRGERDIPIRGGETREVAFVVETSDARREFEARDASGALVGRFTVLAPTAPHAPTPGGEGAPTGAVGVPIAPATVAIALAIALALRAPRRRR